MKKQILIIAVFFAAITYSIAQTHALRIAVCQDCPDDHTAATGTMPLSQSRNGIAYNYAAPDNFPIERVAEDFGQRTLINKCWHTGLDINTGFENYDMGDAIYPLDTGEIKFIKWTPDYKAICIRSNDGTIYAYGHLFYDGSVSTSGMQCGNFLMKEVASPSNEHAVVYFNEDGIPVKAYSTLDDDSVIVKNNFGHDTTIFTTNKVSFNTPVVPLGSSDADYAHVHFYLFRELPTSQNDFQDRLMGGTTGFGYTRLFHQLNPATLISNNDLEYNLTIHDSKSKIEEAGSQKSSIVAKVAIPNHQWANSQKRYVGLGTANEVRFLIKKDHPDSAFSEIVGNRFYGHINLGGLTDSTRKNEHDVSTAQTQRYPAISNPLAESEHALDIAYPLYSTSIGNNNHTGIRTNQYNTATYSSDQASDYYYFSDFYHRIVRGHDPHSQTAAGQVPLARYPGEAQYPDGKYLLRAELETVHRELAATSPADKEIMVDNFRPYITKVVVKRDLSRIFLYHPRRNRV
ncbi:MAG: hypothetical protein R3B47_08965 [Bacteroidia bacterium]